MKATLAEIEKDLACPVCKSSLDVDVRGGRCFCHNCARDYRFAGDVPVLIDNQRSVFDSDAIANSVQKQERSNPHPVRQFIRNATPSITANWCAERNMEQLAERIASGSSRPKVLVVGAGDGGAGVDRLLRSDNVVVISTDVFVGRGVDVAADGHDLPFLDSSFDGVILQAVLEHVADPFRCVDEALRVLRPHGLVYAETPFMYPGHLGAHDFHRFSITGHRRLFRKFKELSAGVGAGPGTAAALAILALFASFSTARWYQLAVLNGLPFLLAWLKYLDRYLASKPQAVDSACTLFFFGEKSETVLSDREVLFAHWTVTARSR